MHRCSNHTHSCLQVSASLASESLNVSAMVVSAAIVASAMLATDTLQARAWADKPIQVDARSLTPPLKVTASLVCDVGEIAPVEGYFITADGFIFATADGYIFRPADL